ncbi:type II secretion system protein E [Alkanindiges hydrocarboniclasticus]|uniref:Type II secretion system protein E n=1 Tax=Alkanindiges hydrocarboniclasticus TaxID=1907941 RepID=A0A1S8D045_9GAMM|nr:GspE/PulE family protein [Alkanindiges hydrocarboniclasticus]ONG42227.1 type II secretion system protein E [Alkanindiges hydrocarboniclasticus]
MNKKHHFSFQVDVRWCLDALLKDGKISQRDVNLIATTPRRKDQLQWHPLQFIASFDLTDATTQQKLTLPLLSQWLAEKADVPFFRIDPLKVNVPAVTAIMSFEYAERHRILAVAVDSETITIGSDQPFYDDWLENLSHIVRPRQIVRVMLNPEQLSRYLIEFYQVTRAIAGAKGTGGTEATAKGVEALLQLGDVQNPDANDQHIVRIVDWLLQYAFDQRASDIHLEPRRQGGRVRFRIDGVLHTVYDMPAPILTAVISRIKILGRMNVAERRKPQDGRLKTRTPKGIETELRLSTLPTAFGEKLVMRIFDPEVLVRSFEQLGLTGDDLAKWRQMAAHPNGIILVTGPTGSGKTTTLYSTLKQLATDEVNVCTIEDPIEMIESSFNQMQVQSSIELGFAEGVRALMRQDPDIIMIGEIRDQDTADMGIQAALTGHLVLSTLHTNDAPSSLTRLHDLGVQPFLTAATILGVMAQRLVRTLCEYCKAPTTIDPESWNQLVSPWTSNPPPQVYQAVGCEHCRGTGYKGRMGLYEILVLTNEMKRLVGDGANLNQIKQQAYREGLQPLRLAGAKRVSEGTTTLEEVMRVVPLS